MTWLDFAMLPDVIYVRFWVWLSQGEAGRVQRIRQGWVH